MHPTVTSYELARTESRTKGGIQIRLFHKILVLVSFFYSVFLLLFFFFRFDPEGELGNGIFSVAGSFRSNYGVVGKMNNVAAALFATFCH